MLEPQGLTRLNLGCGTNIRSSFLNMDYLPATNIYYELEVVKHVAVPNTEPCTITRTHLQ